MARVVQTLKSTLSLDLLWVGTTSSYLNLLAIITHKTKTKPTVILMMLRYKNTHNLMHIYFSVQCFNHCCCRSCHPRSMRPSIHSQSRFASVPAAPSLSAPAALSLSAPAAPFASAPPAPAASSAYVPTAPSASAPASPSGSALSVQDASAPLAPSGKVAPSVSAPPDSSPAGSSFSLSAPFSAAQFASPSRASSVSDLVAASASAPASPCGSGLSASAPAADPALFFFFLLIPLLKLIQMVQPQQLSIKFLLPFLLPVMPTLLPLPPPPAISQGVSVHPSLCTLLDCMTV